MTERQYRVALRWLGLQWNRPDRADYYAMQTAAASCGATNVNTMRISFRSPDDAEEELTPEMLEERIETSKSAAMAATPQGRVEHKVVSAADAPAWDPPVWTESGYT